VCFYWIALNSCGFSVVIVEQASESLAGPVHVITSILKKSMAAMVPQWAFRGRFNTVLGEDTSHGCASGLVTQRVQDVPDSGVSPAGVLPG
jgi:hypothetical protein